MKALKPIKPKKEYENKVAKIIVSYIYNNIFKALFAIFDDNNVENANNIIIEAINSGLIYYQDGAFYSKRKYFNNTISRELENIGAKYSKYRNAYLLPKNKLPLEIIGAIDFIKVKTASTVLIAQNLLSQQFENLSKIEKEKLFNVAIKEIFADLQKRLKANFEAKKIETISPLFTDFIAKDYSQKYTNNLELKIKGWAESRIIKMREIIGQMAIEGKSRKTIAEYLQKEFQVEQRHVLFIARNEIALATTAYLTAKYKEAGFTHFYWYVNNDGRERPLHHELGKKVNNKYGINGTNLFSFDNPPIIDERTGQRGLVGEAYNCRCAMAPAITKGFFQNREKSFTKSLKDLFNGNK